MPWAHLDIAGPAFAEKELPLAPRGATGFGVRLLVEYLRVAARPEPAQEREALARRSARRRRAS